MEDGNEGGNEGRREHETEKQLKALGRGIREIKP